jgi:hypothetical protein
MRSLTQLGKGGLFDAKQRSQVGQAAVASRSAHAADSEKAALEMEKTTKKRIEVTWCEDCKKHNATKLQMERCTAQNHNLRQEMAYEYAHKCGGCGERAYTINESVHRHKCRKSGVHVSFKVTS